VEVAVAELSLILRILEKMGVQVVAALVLHLRRLVLRLPLVKEMMEEQALVVLLREMVEGAAVPALLVKPQPVRHLDKESLAMEVLDSLGL
jgi:hypothetical protein